MATISSIGKQSTDSLGGGLRFEQDNNRIIGRASDGKPNLILSSQPGEQALFEIAQDGYDVTDCTDDQKVMSSKFNMWKIIAHGSFNITPFSFLRNATLSLDATTYLGYEHRTYIDTGIDTGKVISSLTDPLINITWGRAYQFNGSGYLYHDGTNIVWYHNYYYFEPFTDSYGGNLVLVQRFRVLNGSYNFVPNDHANISPLKWSISNQTLTDQGGGGVVGPGAGKYYYLDKIKVDKDGNVLTALASSTVEFIIGEWQPWL